MRMNNETNNTRMLNDECVVTVETRGGRKTWNTTRDYMKELRFALRMKNIPLDHDQWTCPGGEYGEFNVTGTRDQENLKLLISEMVETATDDDDEIAWARHLATYEDMLGQLEMYQSLLGDYDRQFGRFEASLRQLEEQMQSMAHMRLSWMAGYRAREGGDE